MELIKTQTCPYCGDEVDDAQAEWEDDTHIVECDSCGLEYEVRPVYTFEGFEIKPKCAICGEFIDDGICFCNCDD